MTDVAMTDCIMSGCKHCVIERFECLCVTLSVHCLSFRVDYHTTASDLIPIFLLTMHCDIFAVKKLTRVCLKMLSGLQSFWSLAKHRNSVKFRISTKQSLCDKYDVHIQNNGRKYLRVIMGTSRRHICWKWRCCIYAMLRTHRQLVLTVILLKFHKLILK